jgi:CxxC-x17-CxxC domain-containing protein
MGFQDKTLHCADCDMDFTFDVQEQELFASRGYTNEPKRCPSCREARKSQRTGGSSYSSNSYSSRSRQMFPATCAQCGKDTEVPFEPHSDRPVYCSDCYNKIRISR